MTTDTELEAALASAHPDSLTCPTCGSPGRVVSSDEGTSYYQPIAEVRALREARLDVADELPDADHEIASFLHPYIWGNTTHVDEPGDGDDCHECYQQSENLRAVIVAALGASDD